MLAPICLFTYNRLSETQQTVNKLQANYIANNSDLYIFSDGPKNDTDEKKITIVRDYIKNINGFKSIHIIESKSNQGLANSIIQGVTKIINIYGKVIVLEDDLLTTPNFLDFMNQALNFYEFDSNIHSINGYSLKINHNKNNGDVYFQYRTFPWGWGTWNNRWDNCVFDKTKIKELINSDKKILKDFSKKCGSDMPNGLISSINGESDTWYVRWAFDHFYRNKYTVYPILSKIRNDGFGIDSTHCAGINTYVSEPDITHQKMFLFYPFQVDKFKCDYSFDKYFTKKYKLLFRVKMIFNKHTRNLLKDEFVKRFIKHTNDD